MVHHTDELSKFVKNTFLFHQVCQSIFLVIIAIYDASAGINFLYNVIVPSVNEKNYNLVF